MNKVTITTLQKMKQDQKDYEEYLNELRMVNKMRDRLMNGLIFTDRKAELAVILGDYRKILLWMGAQIWPEREAETEEALKPIGIIKRLKRALAPRRKAA